MDWSIAQLLLAYRHAKHALYQEHRGMDRLTYALAERRLPRIIRKLRRHLRKTPGWFSGLTPGEVWLLPKKAVMAENTTGVTSVGEDRPSRVRHLAIRLHLSPSIDFAIVETLWIWSFGPALETLLSESARANRLKLKWDKSAVDTYARGPFAFWPKQYQQFREDGFAVARRLLAGNGRCVVASLDIASYYDNIDPRFLTSQPFIKSVEKQAAVRNVTFDSAEFVRATKTLVAAFRRYYALCQASTGLPVTRGIPIGCLTSRLIANVALSTLDDRVAAQSEVKYYARYVDDVLIVATPKRSIPRSSRSIASRFLPIISRRPKQTDALLDASFLQRPGSEFRLQDSKVKGYVLRGASGRHFLSTIERDVRQIASERRAFLHPDGLGTDSPFASLIVGSDQKAPVQVLRDVDRLKVERYAASVAVSKVGVGARLLNFPESASWCHDQLSPLAGVITDAAHWIEFIELGFRALSVAIQARDHRTARLINTRHRRQWRRFVTGQKQFPLYWNRRRVVNETARIGLVTWFETRRFEEICSSIPFDLLQSARETGLFLESIARKDVRERRLTARNVLRGAMLLSRADLRALDRESDLSKAQPASDIVQGRTDWHAFYSLVRADAELAERFDQIDGFLNACEVLSDKTYAGVPSLNVWLMTRPPTAFDVAYRWAEAGKSLETLVETINALRGTRYELATIRRADEFTVDISQHFFLFGEPKKELLLVLGNLRTGTLGPWPAAKGKPEITRERLTSLGRIVNLAIERRVRSGLATLLLLPELSVPRRWIRPLADRLIAEDVSFVAGLEYARLGGGVVNDALGVFAAGFHAAAVCRWRKTRPAREEAAMLIGKKVKFIEHSPTSILVVNTDVGAFSVLICSELLDLTVRSHLLGRIDLLLVPAWNKDTATFDHTVQTVANDLHCYVAVANNAMFSDCRLQTPSDVRYRRDACRLICRDEDEVISVRVDIDALRTFQRVSLDDAANDPAGFKPIPPGYLYRR
jgi:predicted amidohydrolase